MQSQADIFLDILKFIGSAGYYARTSKEKEIMSNLEKQKLVTRKPGTKRVYILNPDKVITKDIDRSTFTSMLKRVFLESRTFQQPFVPIEEIRNTLETDGISQTLFNRYLTELYDNNLIELEKSFTAQEGKEKGLNYKNKKYFSYILSIN